VEAYAAYATSVWLKSRKGTRVYNFAKWSAIGSLIFGCLGQISYHIMAAQHIHTAPWQITMLVSCFPVGVFGMGVALHNMEED